MTRSLSELWYSPDAIPDDVQPVLVMDPAQAQAFIASQEKILTELSRRQSEAMSTVSRALEANTRALVEIMRRLEKMGDPTISVPVPEVHPHVDASSDVEVLPAPRVPFRVERDHDGKMQRIVPEPG